MLCKATTKFWQSVMSFSPFCSAAAGDICSSHVAFTHNSLTLVAACTADEAALESVNCLTCALHCLTCLSLYFTCTANLAELYCCCADLAKRERVPDHASHTPLREPNNCQQLSARAAFGFSQEPPPHNPVVGSPACFAMFCLRPPPEFPIDLCSPKPQAETKDPSLNPSLSNLACDLPTVAPTPPYLNTLSQPITTNHRLAPVELEALKACKQASPPSRQDVMRCFDMIPRAFMKLGPQGSRYVVGGASPRSRHSILTHSHLLPIFNCLVTKYISTMCPQHKFTTYVLRTGALDKPHRDTKNAPLPSFIQALRTPNPHKDGLWLHDPVGTVPKIYEGNLLKGTVIPLHEPYLFQPRSVLHAGHVQDSTDSLGRLILIAFTTIHGSVLSELTRLELCDLGFRIPNAVDFHRALHGSIPGDFPRLRQLSMQEALKMPPEELDKHDVVPLHRETIEISDGDSDCDLGC